MPALRKILLWAGAAVFAAVFLSIGWVAGSRLGAEDPAARKMARNIEGLESSKVFERAFAAHDLGEAGDARAVEPLIKALRDPADAVRFNAVEALGLLGGPRSVAALKRCIEDKSPELRTRAAAALEGLGEKTASPSSADGNPPSG
ncbi:MAG: HEAT repeat domain-containing protein [Elusimicrobia bacterium]|nr:HEAT repeat domain-containing protein [Elusimicrobiota bacterium]